MKKRKLVEKIAREGCEDVDCHECSFIGHDGACSLPGDTAVAFAKQWLVAHPKKDKPCPQCDGNGTVSELAMSPNGSSSTMTPKKCPLCLGTGKRLKRADLEAEVVRLREGK
jgi:RecJ-like exonuclease